jgi:parvulin-like peptidyl-prolyl isomerase
MSSLALAMLLGAAAYAAPPILNRNAAPATKTVAPATATQPVAKAPAPPQSAPASQRLQVVAVVNREEITREELGRQCVSHYGQEVLEGLVSKQLIIQHCQRLKISVTEQDVKEEIDRLAKKFSLPTEQWLKMLEKERGVTARQYANDVIWPMLALRRVAAAELTVSKQEIDEAYQSEFGPAVKARIIAISSDKKARSVLAEAKARPDDFGALARKYSEDSQSASANGLVQPIRRFMGDKALEDVAFNLREGEISNPVQVGEMHVIVKCEGRLKPTNPDRSQVDKLLEEALRERKLRAAGVTLFKKLRDQSKIEIVLGNPEKSKQTPGVAAIVNGRSISLAELTDECVERNGREALEGTINRRLIEQALRREHKEITQQDIDAEIARAALSMGKIKRPGVPDIEGWIEYITKQQGVTKELYVRDSVWPSVALKKIVGGEVGVTEDELRKGFEANFGQRVRARAIVCSNQRKAQDVWEKARQNPTPEYFGKLAEEYSVEATSRSLRGEVPPIARFGGQPELEKEAFQLQAGELSSIIQTGPTFVILLCEGRTDPVKVDFREVKDEIQADLVEKKLRLAMGKKFEELKDLALIDNFLTGSIKSPKDVKAAVSDPSVKPAGAIGKSGAAPRGRNQQRDPDATTIDDLMKDDVIPK